MLETAIGLPQFAEIGHPEGLDIRNFGHEIYTSYAGALYILNAVQNNPTAAITYATGVTMEPVYTFISQHKDRLGADFSRTSAFHLDERYPCAPTDPASFARFIKERVVEPFGIPSDQVQYWNGLAADPDVEAARYDTLLAKQPINLVILGVGPAGKHGDRKGSHLAFNETGTPFDSESHYVAKLSEETLFRDRIERGELVPPAALTQGLATITRAQDILLIAYGTNKGVALRDALYGPPLADCPASILRLPEVKSKVHIFVDQMAAAVLKAPRL